MSTGRRRRILRAAAGALAAAALLAGCAGIPTEGPVGTQPIDAGDDGGGLAVLPEGPQDGWTPEQLLLGFLRAQRAPRDEYQVARLFLTDEFRTTWDPTARVLISNTPMVPQEVDEDSYTVTVRIDAEVNAAGNYSELAEPQTQPLPYEFQQNADGEWRISSAPAGTVIPASRFATAFLASPLYFYEPSGRYLVPDIRWYPDTASRADRIVRDLLVGQSDWYAEGVLVNSFPQGAQLEGITVEGGVAAVDLSSEVAAQPVDARWRMQQQLSASLATLTDVLSVEMTVGGFPIDVGSGQVPDRALPVSAKTLGFADGAFGYLSRDAVERLDGLSDQVEARSPLGATLARDHNAVAVRSGDGAWLIRTDADPLRVDARPGLIDPGIDNQGYVWSVPADEPGALIAVGADGVQHPVSAPYLDGTITTLDVSRDGSRLLVATQRGDGPAVWMIGIVRDADGVPTRLGSPLQLTVDDRPLVDAAWVDASTIAIISGSGLSSVIDLYRIGGRHESAGAVANAVQLVGGNTADGLRVRDADGTVWRRGSSGGWQSTGIVASFLGTQQ